MEVPCACNGTLKVFVFSLFLKKKIVFSSSFLLVLTSGYLWVSVFSDSLPLFFCSNGTLLFWVIFVGF